MRFDLNTSSTRDELASAAIMAGVIAMLFLCLKGLTRANRHAILRFGFAFIFIVAGLMIAMFCGWLALLPSAQPMITR